MVPHRGTNWAAPWLTSQIGRDAVLSRSYGRGYFCRFLATYNLLFPDPIPGSLLNSRIPIVPSSSFRRCLESTPKCQGTFYLHV